MREVKFNNNLFDLGESLIIEADTEGMDESCRELLELNAVIDYNEQSSFALNDLDSRLREAHPMISTLELIAKEFEVVTSKHYIPSERERILLRLHADKRGILAERLLKQRVIHNLEELIVK